MRSFFWLWVVFLFLCMVTDSASYWVIRNRLNQGLELALDAALVAGIIEDDLVWGRQLSSEQKAAVWATDILKKNLSGPLAKTLVFQFHLSQDQELIWAEGQARVEGPYLLGVLVGKGRREIAVNKRMQYQGSYK